MLADRPPLATALATRPVVRQWLLERFAGAGQGFAVDWEAEAPLSGQPAEHLLPQTPGGHAKLRIAQRVSGLDQLAEVVFELTNMEGAADLTDLWNEAVRHTVSRGAFAEGMTRIEHKAVGRFKGLARQLGLSPGPRDLMLRHLLETPDDYAAYRSWILAQASYDPEAYWGKAYDDIDRPKSSESR